MSYKPISKTCMSTIPKVHWLTGNFSYFCRGL